MKDLTGQKVLMSPKYAKWHLDHPEVYINSSDVFDSEFYEEIMLHMVAVMGEPVPGVIAGTGSQCYWVDYELDGFKASYYVARKDLIFI